MVYGWNTLPAYPGWNPHFASNIYAAREFHFIKFKKSQSKFVFIYVKSMRCNNPLSEKPEFGSFEAIKFWRWPLHENCPNTKFFWSVFSCIWNDYEDFLRKSSYSVQIQGNNDHKKLRIWTYFTQWICLFKKLKLAKFYLYNDCFSILLTFMLSLWSPFSSSLWLEIKEDIDGRNEIEKSRKKVRSLKYHSFMAS